MAKDRVESGAGRTAAAIAIALFLAFAAWRAYTLSLANIWAEHASSKSLQIRSGFPRAVFARAERRIRHGQPAAADNGVLRQALADSPLDGRGFRYLAAAADTHDDHEAALRLYALAAARSPRDLPSLAWLGDRELERGDYRAALARLDRIIRVEPQREHHLQDVFLKMAVTPAAQSALADALAASPPWRERTLRRILARRNNSAAVFPLIERLRHQPGGLTDEELSTWIDRLAADGQWGAAYSTWVESLSPEASRQIGNVFNGSFEHEPSQAGFDWRFEGVAGAHASIEQTTQAAGNLALRVAFSDDRVPFKHVRQLLALPPGRFRLSGRARLENLRTQRGLVWNVTCFGTKTALGQSEALSGSRDWSLFTVEFEVPAHGCGGQWLTLMVPARIPAEQRIGGVAWFDDLKVKAL
jgi:tetratricopeptide (TPR) repeat protein